MRAVLIADSVPSHGSFAGFMAGIADDLVVKTISSDAFREVTEDSADIVLLVIQRVFPDGSNLLARIRSSGLSLPLLILAETATSRERALALEIGADDCISAPFDAVELMARITALVRRNTPPRYLFGNAIVDLARGAVQNQKQHFRLSAKELDLLRYFLDRGNCILSREELLREVWGYCSTVTRTVDVHVSSLRQKLEPNPHLPSFFVTVRGKGYLFRPAVV